MLFNSYIFIFIFLPITLLGFHLIGKQGRHRVAIAWLVGASLFFYGWWNPAYLGLLLFSIIFNYSIGISLGSTSDSGLSKKAVLVTGIVVNLSLIGYFKYANFFIDNLNTLASTNITLSEIILPLGISFFTFQQITYLVDAYDGKTKEYNFLHYCLFVTFFPQLIAGPIVHHKEMLPQFAKDVIYRLNSKYLAIGLTIFALGLFKKVILADGISIYATPVFDAAEAGVVLTFFEAWAGSFAYAFQLYFDFSGYSDMAIGLAYMFGILLPFNFNSPYKAINIADFWRRWHITLSRLIRDYLWNPVSLSLTRYAMNKKYGRFSTFILNIVAPIIFSFFLIGLWHGAGWNFVLFGLLHGLYIIIFNIWTRVKYSYQGVVIIKSKNVSHIIGWLITFTSVVLSWVLFRADSIEASISIYSSMFGLNGISLPVSLDGKIGFIGGWLEGMGVVFHGMFVNGVFGSHFVGVGWIFVLGFISTMLFNTQEIMFFEKTTKKIMNHQYFWYRWRPTKVWAVFTAVLLIFSILNLSNFSEFLYFQF